MDELIARKMKLPETGRVAVLEAPEGYLEKIGRTPEETELDGSEASSYDFVQAFALNAADVERLGPLALRAVKPDGLLWMCYPKGTSKLKTNINRDIGWRVLSEAGWEGIALVSIDETWSAMRFRPVSAVGKSRPSPAERRAAAASKPPSAPPETPADLRSALDAVPDAAAAFDGLAPSHKREYVTWILDAKKAETRASRIGKAVDKLSRGLKRPSDKE